MAGKAASEVDALVPDDPRVQHLDAQIGPYTYHYMLATPDTAPIATVLLVHGWPDLGMAWRYQVPFLTSLGLRVIVPDMLGYGKTSAPAAVEEYTLKKLSGHLVALVEQVVGGGGGKAKEPIIFGGHDWGAALVWRMAMWYPDLPLGVFALNVAYAPAHKQLVSFDALFQRIPTLKYQRQLASPVAEAIVDKSEGNLRSFINGMYGGVGPNGERVFSPSVGILEENLATIGPAVLMKPDMVDFYVKEYSRHGMHGPTNWYRTRDLNFEDEKPFAEIEGGFMFKVPAMVVMGEKDIALPPSLADGMEKWFEKPLKKEVAKGVGHWAMWQDPTAINNYIGEFLHSILGDQIKEKL